MLLRLCYYRLGRYESWRNLEGRRSIGVGMLDAGIGDHWPLYGRCFQKGWKVFLDSWPWRFGWILGCVSIVQDWCKETLCGGLTRLVWAFWTKMRVLGKWCGVCNGSCWSNWFSQILTLYNILTTTVDRIKYRP